MMPLAYARSLCAQELEEFIKYSGLANEDKNINERIRQRTVTKNNKTIYVLPFKGGTLQVYGPRYILLNKEKYTSMYLVKLGMKKYFQL